MSQMVTRCPKCATAFRITSTQLESAKGAVRCGSCLHIFKAQDYLVKSSPTESANPPDKKPTPAKQPNETPSIKQMPLEALSKSTTPVTPTPIAQEPTIKKSSAPIGKDTTTLEPTASAKPTSTPVIDKAKALEDEEDVLISDDMDQSAEKGSAYEFDGFLDIDLRPKQTVSLFEREIKFDVPHDDDQKEPEDESWAENLLDDNEEEQRQIKKPVASEKKFESDENKSVSTKEEPQQSTGYSGPVFSIIAESTDPTHDESDFSEEFLNATRPLEETAKRADDAASFAAALFNSNVNTTSEEDEEEYEEKAGSKRPVKSSKMRAFDTSRAALLMNIMPAPVEFTAKRMRRWYQRKLWSTLSLLLALLFLFQIAYFKFDYFSRIEPYRTAYLFACSVVGCEVPTLVDVSQVQIRHLTVRTHSEIEGALRVEAIILNTAPFEQPFPDLVLSFAKIDDTPVATRAFKSQEYLGGELAGATLIPKNQPIHIELEIADPGPDAVNYTLATH